MPSLPVRVTGSGTAIITGVIDPEESEATQKLRVNVHNIRVGLIRAARRLGYEHDNGLVKQVSYHVVTATGYDNTLKLLTECCGCCMSVGSFSE